MTTMSGKVCLVTGGTSGIGLETAARLAELGATVGMSGATSKEGERQSRRSGIGRPAPSWTS